ncbi:hypothetical protein C4N20_15175 [Fusobacterium ulcerans]|uniref:Trigger factor C-terminal domain-containing protein n=3 Tax=Fusobacterium ulcerans TaxID=861 RepID=A0AAX2JBN7_9FUSO|nr:MULTISPECIES: hypothetical protein [Fusobacterium]AVQ29377.1 hypothetical protein C4N20_15175 [Fusobacterium ulcerans]EFS27211.1 hypothetical protein FUAG_02726 [Fusobacterium ulcerans ATCC 49185]EHO81017.1 hypothetical protein HMPREF0402_01727 [Fusobacterium ulcerans 12-1B]MCB8565484.1 hypothetical protein [Fusobacterium ulcerans]MCB8649487.1 hypothetical protein [Fusobacterium ulcerans]
MIKLTEKELENVRENKDAIAQLLVRKAILNEMKEKKYTAEEEKHLEELKLNMEIEFYLTTIAQNNITISDYELLEVYKNNTEILKDKTIMEVYPQLQQALINQKINEGKLVAINEIIEKHKLNEILKEYTGEEKNQEIETKE